MLCQLHLSPITNQTQRLISVSTNQSAFFQCIQWDKYVVGSKLDLVERVKTWRVMHNSPSGLSPTLSLSYFSIPFHHRKEPKQIAVMLLGHHQNIKDDESTNIRKLN